jgi:hypothetical protein
MNPFPEDIFTEPDDVDSDTLANLGPLRRLAGVWESAKGLDINPKADGPERKQYIERIEMQPIDAQTNGPQLFFGLHYHIHINTPEEDITFHDQVGHWLWEPATGLVLQSLSIPRGQAALASGHADGVTQGAISQHIKTLKLAGLVAERPEGRQVFYRVRPEGLEPLFDWMSHYDVFWRERFASLRNLLKEIDP